jgi:hypothetical protein
MTQHGHKVDDVADREDEDGSELTVRGLVLPRLLVSLLDSGRWRHPGDDVLVLKGECLSAHAWC